jgi:hypothetical protein
MGRMRDRASSSLPLTIVTVCASAGLGVAVNLATGWKTNLWAWASVVVLTLVGGGATYWLARRQSDLAASAASGLVVHDAHIGGDNIQLRVQGNLTINNE